MSVRLFSPDDTAVLLIDRQVGTMSWARSTEIGEMKANALALARAAKALGMPLVLTSSLEDRAQGPLARSCPRSPPTSTRRGSSASASSTPWTTWPSPAPCGRQGAGT